MSTQFITVDGAPYIRFAGPQGAEVPRAGALLDIWRFADDDFFNGKSIAELAHDQGVGPVKDIRIFAGVIPDDDDVNEMLDEIYRLREP